MTDVWTYDMHYSMLNIQVAGFDWDGGNREKCRRHGLSLEEIEEFFRQGMVHVAPDIRHSEAERRFLAIGKSPVVTGKPVIVAFTLRESEGKRLIRPITARYMHAKELRKYEREIAGHDNG